MGRQDARLWVYYPRENLAEFAGEMRHQLDSIEELLNLALNEILCHLDWKLGRRGRK